MWEIHGKEILKYLLLPTLLKINKFTAVLLNRTIVKQATLSTATVSCFYNQMLDPHLVKCLINCQNLCTAKYILREISMNGILMLPNIIHK